MLMKFAERAVIAFIIGFILGMLFQPAHAKNLGQFEDNDFATKQWFRNMMQPDQPQMSCCGEADAYYADEVHVKDGKTYATITDERPDGPLMRNHIDVGTVIEIPDNKLTFKDGNPTGHNILFVMYASHHVICFVQNWGT